VLEVSLVLKDNLDVNNVKLDTPVQQGRLLKRYAELVAIAQKVQVIV